MKVSLDEVETKGLRCPDSKISFKNKSNGGVINLIQMPNGTGKTTIIKLISASITGDIRKWSPDEVRAYRNKIVTSNNGEFRITLSLETKGVKQLTFLTRFNFEDGTAEIFTTRGQIGEEQGWLPSAELRQFFSTGCVDVFCFQGDKTKDIIDENKNDAEVTIKAFFGFNEIDDFIEDIKKYHRDTIQTGAPITTTNIQAKLNQANEWHLRAKELEGDYDEKLIVKKEIDKRETELMGKQGRIIEALNGTSRQEELDKNSSKAEIAVASTSYQCWNDLKNPLLIPGSLLSELNIFKNSLEKLKLPGGSRSFFVDLINEDDGCICGEDLTKERVQHIENEIENYLGDDESIIVNNIKQEIKDAYENLMGSNSLEIDFTALNNALDDRTTILKEKEDYLKEMEELATPENQKIFADYRKVVERQTKINAIIESRTKDYKVESSQFGNPKSCKSYIAAGKVAERLFNEAGEISDKKEISESYKTLKKIVNAAKHNSLKKIKENLALKTNEKLSEILPEGQPIAVLGIDKYLELGWNGISCSEGSGAQNIIIAYSFARSVLEEAHIEFPLVVDHPFTQIDKNNRKQLGDKLPSLMHQFIGFLIDVERPGFLEGVADQTGIHYISMFSSEIKGNKNFIEKIETLPTSEYEKTSNGYITYNKNFFIENEMGDH